MARIFVEHQIEGRIEALSDLLADEDVALYSDGYFWYQHLEAFPLVNQGARLDSIRFGPAIRDSVVAIAFVKVAEGQGEHARFVPRQASLVMVRQGGFWRVSTRMRERERLRRWRLGIEMDPYRPPENPPPGGVTAERMADWSRRYVALADTHPDLADTATVRQAREILEFAPYLDSVQVDTVRYVAEGPRSGSVRGAVVNRSSRDLPGVGLFVVGAGGEVDQASTGPIAAHGSAEFGAWTMQRPPFAAIPFRVVGRREH